MTILTRVFKLVLKYPWRATISLTMAVACTLLVLVLPTVTQVLVDDVIGKRREDLLIQTGALGIGAIFIRQVLFTLRTYGNNALELRLTHDLRVELYDKLQRLPVKWFDTNSSGEIMSRVANDVPATDRVIIEGVDQAIAAVLQFLIMAGYMFYHSWELTLVTLAPLPVIGLITTIYSKRAEPRGASPPKPPPRSTPSSTTTSPASARSRPTPWNPRRSTASTSPAATSEKSTCG